MTPHSHADDTQLYGFRRPSATNWNHLGLRLVVSPTRSVCDLAVYIDADLSMHSRRDKSVHASLIFVRFVACNVPSQDTPCYHWSMHLLLARMTTVTWFWLEYLEISYAGYSLSWMPPLLRELHWVKVPERIQFWLGMLAYQCLHNRAWQCVPGFSCMDMERTAVWR